MIMKKLFEKLFEGFWLKFGLILGTGILCLFYNGLGFILGFLYFVGFLVYNMTKKE